MLSRLHKPTGHVTESTEVDELRAHNAELSRKLADAEAERNAANAKLDLMNRVTAYQLHLAGKMPLTPEQRERLFEGMK